jgi:hypothetical protein
LVGLVDVLGPDDEDVDIGLRATVPTGRRAKHRCRCWGYRPLLELLPDSLEQPSTQVQQRDGGVSSHMIAVEAVQLGGSRFENFQKPVRNHPLKDVLDGLQATSAQALDLSASQGPGGPSNDCKHIGVGTGHNSSGWF